MALLIQSVGAFEVGQMSLDIIDKLLGTDDGGNMYFALKYAPIDNFLITVDHTRAKSAMGLGTNSNDINLSFNINIKF